MSDYQTRPGFKYFCRLEEDEKWAVVAGLGVIIANPERGCFLVHDDGSREPLLSDENAVWHRHPALWMSP